MCIRIPQGRSFRAAFFAWVLLTASINHVVAQSPKSVPPEALLAADSVLYFRYDGYEPHRQAYDKTTLARIMKDDLGEFLDYLGTFTRDLAVRELLRGGEGKPVEKDKAIADTKKFTEYFWKHGVVVGVEVGDDVLAGSFYTRRRGLPGIDPRRAGRENWDTQAIIVFPQAGLPANRPAVFAFLKMLTDMAGAEIIEKKEGTRTFFTTEERIVNWWQEGDHVVLRIGTDSMKATLDVMDGRKPNLTATPLFKNLTAFKSYETDMRGLVNLEKIVELLRAPGEKDRQLDMIVDALTRHLILHQLGVNGIKGLTFHMGFSGKFQRKTVMLHVPEREDRTGLLRALTRAEADPKSFDLDKLPPLPPNAADVHVMNVDWVGLYDYVYQMTKLFTLAQKFGQGGGPDFVFSLDALLNLNFRKDVLEALEPTVVLYGAHTEGPFYLGQGVAIKVKDGKKLGESTEAMNKVLIDSGLGVRFQKRPYRGVDMYMLNSGPNIRGPDIFGFVPLTYTLHKDWFVLGLFPQSVKGFILRSEGDRKVWQAPSYYKELLAQCLKEGGPNSRLAGLSVIDPTPTFEMGLAVLPIFAQYLSIFAPTSRFDVSKIPNAQAVTEFVYPKVRFYFDDGTALRWESHFAIDLPMESLLLPYFSLFVLAAGF
jgi:hypothetical protein